MKKTIFAILIPVFLHAGIARADDKVDCTNAMTQTDMNACSAQDWKKADAELNSTYKKVMALGAMVKNKEQVKETEKIWLKYRDAQCNLMAGIYEGGSIKPMVYAMCMTQLTEQRTAVLKSMIADLDH